ncbi:MAG TPA: hypothetical protein DDX00_06415 [Acinetobacter radioresistens]|nr:hypothetical protein [Acinetobacter radioresistens]
MKLKHFSKMGLGLFTALMLTAPGTYAAENNKAGSENIDVTPQQQVTQEELAAVYVLSEICPGLIGKDQKFNEGYSRLAQAHMPGEKNAVSALEKRSKAKNFQSVLKEARQDAKNAGKSKNTQVCRDVASYGA